VNKTKKIKKGDLIGIVSPAGPTDSEELQKGISVLKKMGFCSVLGKNALLRNGFLAGSDEERSADFMDMVKNPDVAAILCARGGYGINRILSHLDFSLIKKARKPIIGSSDITILLNYINSRCSLVSFHGPMAAGSFGRTPMTKSRKPFCQALMGDMDMYSYSKRSAWIINSGKGEGRLAGGCLTLMIRSLGTPYEVQTRNRILIIEDVNERPYKIDGMLWQLKEAGKFKGIRGIVFGEMINCQPNKSEPYTLRKTISDFFKTDNFPVLMNCPVGHGKEMWTLPLGVPAILDSEAKSLTIKENGAV
jgi:muramoyltetrapeptide carboxypeptidase